MLSIGCSVEDNQLCSSICSADASLAEKRFPPFSYSFLDCFLLADESFTVLEDLGGIIKLVISRLQKLSKSLIVGRRYEGRRYELVL